jgi:hypothetical protein
VPCNPAGISPVKQDIGVAANSVAGWDNAFAQAKDGTTGEGGADKDIAIKIERCSYLIAVDF